MAAGSAKDWLSQEEVDALLDGGATQPAPAVDEAVASGVPRAYRFTDQDLVVRGRLPALELVNDRFARYFRASLFDVLRKTCEVSVLGVTMVKFSDYLHSLVVPSDLNFTRVVPLRGTALTVFEPTLVFGIVNNFFGGTSSSHARIEGREFSAVENRVIQLVLEKVFAGMHDAWAPVMELEFKFVSSEVNLQFANIVSPSETVVVSRFHVEIEGGGGDIHLTMPYAMIEPIRDLLVGGIQSDRVERDERWIAGLSEQVLRAEVAVSARLPDATLSLREFSRLKAGDVLLLQHAEQVTFYAEDVPLFRGHMGTSHDNVAVQLDARLELPEPAGAGSPGAPATPPHINGKGQS
ncbi:MAG TPA: flagellar motor switch protein FliM [Rhodanobacteraceae bacterium]|nr:flagellar motor switch protein FliM [Rhodanobacteraceae bacterium]